MAKQKVLIVDDDEFVCEDIATALNAERFLVDKAHDWETAFQLFKEVRHAMVITDLEMGQGQKDGLALLERIKQISEETAVIILTGYNDVQKAVKAMKLGAIDYITKPYEPDQIVVKIEKIADRVQLQTDNQRLRLEFSSQFDIIGTSKPIEDLKRQIASISKSNSRVLISGPNGSGKELVAWSIRNQSSLFDKPFVVLNCAAIPDNLIESELFGTTKGAYTGALDKKGKFELANDGTLFLDEIGDMSLAAQAKVLRVLETGMVNRLGSESSIKTNVRVISATNKDLPALIREGKFREDLYFRLCVIPLRTVPLKDRKEDIPLLIEHILKKLGKAQEVMQVFSPESMQLLKSLPWTGNVRELNNVVERIFIFWDGGLITPDTIREYVHVDKSDSMESSIITDITRTLKEATNEFESDYILKVIQACDGNITDAAEKLGLKRPYLYEKMKNLGIAIFKR